MMNISTQEQESGLLEFSAKYIHQRYRLIIVCGMISSGKTNIAKRVEKRLQANYIDIASELLPKIIEDQFTPTLGAFGPEDLVQYISNTANRADVKYLLIDQVEPLLSTFGRKKAVLFFQMLSQMEPLRQVVLFTYLKKQIEEARFTKERIIFYNIT